jgi:hypothetical protein
MTIRPSLLALAAYTRAVEEEFIAALTAEERSAAGSPEDWSAKDLVAHVTTWRERGATDLGEVLRGPLPPEPEAFDEANRAIFDQNQSQSWEQIRRRARDSWSAFSQNLSGLPEDLLVAAPGPGGARPLWRRITVDAGNHPVLHYAEFSRRGGRIASATRWMEGLTPLLLAVDASGEWHAVIYYNLACHYAQTGATDKALDSLELSLTRNPALRDWSRQDADLASIRSHPRFTSLAGTETQPD